MPWTCWACRRSASRSSAPRGPDGPRMPELPEVEAVRRRAERLIVGRRIRAVATVDDPVVYDGVRPASLARALRGRVVRGVRRRGKHLWLELDRRPWPAFH